MRVHEVSPAFRGDKSFVAIRISPNLENEVKMNGLSVCLPFIDSAVKADELAEDLERVAVFLHAFAERRREGVS